MNKIFEAVMEHVAEAAMSGAELVSAKPGDEVRAKDIVRGIHVAGRVVDFDVVAKIRK